MQKTWAWPRVSKTEAWLLRVLRGQWSRNEPDCITASRRDPNSQAKQDHVIDSRKKTCPLRLRLYCAEVRVEMQLSFPKSQMQQKLRSASRYIDHAGNAGDCLRPSWNHNQDLQTRRVLHGRLTATSQPSCFKSSSCDMADGVSALRSQRSRCDQGGFK